VVKPNFLFAGYTAAALVAATGLVAIAYDLPVRDPDGVAATYVVLPLIVLGAIALDIVPRAVWRTRRHPSDLPAALNAVRRERWAWSHLRFALTGLGTWYLSYAAFRNLKSYVPFVNDRLWDSTLADYDRTLWMGHDPAQLLHDLFGTGWAAYFFSFVYVAWIALVPVSLAIALVWSRKARAGSWYVTAIAADWALGVAAYFAVPTLGPAYTAPGQFAALPHTWVTGLISGMMDDRVEVLSDPFATHSVQTIAAFPSLHVAIAVTACLMTYQLGLPRVVQLGSLVFLGLTVVATIYFGWHFFVDTVAGAAVGAAAVWVSALGTGNHVHGWPRLHPEQASDEPANAQSSADRTRSA
jgi:membrane-associated phospholipid phosphatase